MSEEPQKPLQFEIQRGADETVVTCHGRLVAGTTDEFYREVKELFPGTKLVIIDLADLNYVDSMGLGTLVRLHVHARQSDSQLKLLHLGKQLRNVLRMTNLLSVFAHAEDQGITIA